jgi:hypothetical protein
VIPLLRLLFIVVVVVVVVVVTVYLVWHSTVAEWFPILL